MAAGLLLAGACAASDLMVAIERSPFEALDGVVLGMRESDVRARRRNVVPVPDIGLQEDSPAGYFEYRIARRPDRAPTPQDPLTSVAHYAEYRTDSLARSVWMRDRHLLRSSIGEPERCERVDALPAPYTRLTWRTGRLQYQLVRHAGRARDGGVDSVSVVVHVVEFADDPSRTEVARRTPCDPLE